MKPLTIVYTCARTEPHINWFLDSLRIQCKPNEPVQIIIVDLNCDKQWPEFENYAEKVIRISPKPTIWQGKHRITSKDWWAKSNALNTGICLCKTDWIAFVDDRCVLADRWCEAVERSMGGVMAVCGSYEKHINMKVEGGKIVDPGQTVGLDHRRKRGAYRKTMGGDWFGCTNALPLEYALMVNGYPEDYCDGHSYEDTTFGRLLSNAGKALLYRPEMMVIEDRTPGECGPDMRRVDKGISPNDKSHALVRRFQREKTSQNSFNIREVRNSVLSGKPFPMPSANHHDWYDGQAIKDME